MPNLGELETRGLSGIRAVGSMPVVPVSHGGLEVEDSLVFCMGLGAEPRGLYMQKADGSYEMIGAGGSASDPLDLSVTDPASPSSGITRLFRRAIAGREMPAFIGPSGLDSTLQPLLARNKVGFWCPPGNATTVPGIFGFTAYTATGTATSRAFATTSVLTRMRRIGYVSGATAGSLCGARVSVAQITTGTTIGGVPVGGFFKVIRFGISDAASVTTARMFVGISATTAAPTNVEPSTLVNCVGVGHNLAHTNLHLFHGGSAAQTPIDLGANFPKTPNAVYELALFCAPASTNIGYTVSRLDASVPAVAGLLTGTAGTQLPSPTTAMTYAQSWRSNGTTASAVGLDICSDYIETDQ